MRDNHPDNAQAVALVRYDAACRAIAQASQRGELHMEVLEDFGEKLNQSRPPQRACCHAAARAAPFLQGACA